MEKQANKKIELMRANVVVKERKGDFLILTTGTLNMDLETKTCHVICHQHILEEMGIAPAAQTPSTSEETTSIWYHKTPLM
jgi:hypothetical protein